jgi:hypothetical protein
MTPKTYKFQDGHPTGGLSTVTITEPQIIEYMKQFVDNQELTDTQCVMRFLEDRKATPIAPPSCRKTSKVCSKGDKCCKNQAMKGFVPNRKGTEL